LVSSILDTSSALMRPLNMNDTASLPAGNTPRIHRVRPTFLHIPAHPGERVMANAVIYLFGAIGNAADLEFTTLLAYTQTAMSGITSSFPLYLA
jgi:hypothetical protein